MTDLSTQIKTKFQMLLVENSATVDSKLKISSWQQQNSKPNMSLSQLKYSKLFLIKENKIWGGNLKYNTKSIN